jgi:hypothetical protein
MNKSPWQSLEEYSRRSRNSEVWRERLGENFGAFCVAFLEPGEARSVSVGNEAEGRGIPSQTAGSNERPLELIGRNSAKRSALPFGLDAQSHRVAASRHLSDRLRGRVKRFL